ncbi:MAG: glutamate--tRNA ligase [Magnetococcales bacterium]|nr:glutamate--tRNA ligase [Magnetococcales bacterium]
MTVRTRFAPSPTGFLHIGGARTALFCYLHTRRVGGTFILRVEDTDRERSTQEAVDAILEGLHWLGLDPDEGPYFQSDNTAHYLEAARRLLEEGKAYRCYCSRETLDELREQQRAQQIKPRYDGRCRALAAAGTPFPDGQPYVIRFQTPTTGVTAWEDQIQGTIQFPNEELDDLVLVRSDGAPTYNLAVVVDDHNMGITLVIRGEDHISNTPRQMHLFQAMGWPVPHYAHMPLLHGADGSKLSKRHGAVSVLQYRQEGFLPTAVNNYLVRLGWSHGEQEIFTQSEMEQWFDVREVGRSAAIFDLAKLMWINGHHMRAAHPDQLLPDLLFHLAQRGITDPDPQQVRAIIPEFQPRAKTLVEMAEKCHFFFVDSVLPYEEKAAQKHFLTAPVAPYRALLESLTALPEWEMAAITQAFQQTVAAHGLTVGQLAQPVRVALTGTSVSPGIYEVLYLLGREKSLSRLQEGARLLGNAQEENAR